MPEDPPDAGESKRPSRARRAFLRARIALALIAPVVALVAVFLIARTSGDADADRVANLDTPTAAASVMPAAEPRFSNPMFGGGTFSNCPSATPPGYDARPTPTPVCSNKIEISFTNHWLS
jgi:hypothetical protein